MTCAVPAVASPPLPDPPLRFEPLVAQSPDSPDTFFSRGPGYSILLDHSGIAGLALPAPNRFHLRFLNANPRARIEGSQSAPSVTNYYRFQAPPLRVPNFHRLTTRNLYPGIDVVYYFRHGRLEYDFVVRPRANPESIRFALRGAASPRLGTAGGLELPTASGLVRQQPPVVYQTIAGSRREIAARYRIHPNGSVSFQLGAYDKRCPLIIDPVLDLSSFASVSPGERAPRLASDLAGNSYLAGFGLAGAERSDTDVSVSKISPSGDLLYTTFFGGPGNDYGLAVAVDPTGRVIVAGSSDGLLDPTPGAYVSDSRGSDDAFIARLDNEGRLDVLSVLGGSASDQINAIAIAPSGSIHLTGQTSSTDFPQTVAAPDAPQPGSPDAFIATLDADAAHLQFARRVGGSGSDRALAIHLDQTGRITIAGVTSGPDFPTTEGAFQRLPAGGDDAFLVQLNQRGDRLRFSTLYGGSGDDASFALASGPEGDLFLAGGTTSRELPSEGSAGATALSGEDAFVAQLDGNASVVYHSSRLTSPGFDRAYDLAVDPSNSAVVAGVISTSGIPAPFVARLSQSGALAFNGPVGSDGAATSLRLLDSGRVEVAGYRGSAASGGAFFSRFDPITSFCPLHVEPAILIVPPSGGPLELRVRAGESCHWQASSAQPWIHVTSNANGSGAGVVRLDIEPAAAPGDGLLVIGDRSIPVLRAAAPNLATGVFTAARLLAVNGQTGAPDPTALLVLNPTNGALIATIGNTNRQIVGLATRPSDGVLFGVTARNAPADPRRLVTLNTSTGAATAVSGDLAIPIHDLAFFGDVLYGWGGSHSGTGELLYRLNTGGATALGSNTGFSSGAGLALAPSGNFYQAGLTSATLNTVDRNSGALSPGPIMSGSSDNRFTALETAPSGELFGITRPGANQDRNNATKLVVVNPSSGQIVTRGTTPIQGISAIAWQPCTGSVSPAELNLSQSGGVTNVTVTTTAGCYWSSSASSAWGLSVNASSGVGGGAVVVTAPSNGGPPRTGSVTVAGLTLTVNQAGLPNTCPASVTPTAVNVSANAATQLETIAVAANCTWTATTSTPWITFTGPVSGTGNGSVTLSFSANNTSVPRTGSVSIAGQTITVNQQSPSNTCPAALLPSRLSAGSVAISPYVVAVTAAQGCSWSATTNAPWITVTTGPSGSGRGSVAFNIAANPGAARTGNVNIAGQTFTVEQQASSVGCFVTPTKGGISFPSIGSPIALEDIVPISSPSGCPWSVSNLPAWLSASPPSGTGPGSILLAATSNNGPPRAATISIAGRDFAVVQQGIFSSTLYGTDGATRADNSHPISNLYRLNPATGAVIATLGSTGFSTVGLAISPITGQLFGVTSRQSAFPENLVRLDLTGATTIIGSVIGSLGAGIRELAFDTDGTLYGWGNAFTFDLYTIDTATGAATKVGEAGIPGNIYGYGLHFNTDAELYYASQLTGSTNNFYRVNKTTGSLTPLANLSGSSDSKVAALDSLGDGRLLALTHQQLSRSPVANLASLNPVTGVLSPIGRTVDYLAGIAALNCIGAVSPGKAAIPAAGGPFALGLVTGPACSWTASESAPWLTLATPSGQGTAAVAFSAAANTGAPRSIAVTVSGRTVDIFQESAPNACSAAVAPTSATVNAAASSLSVTVTAAAGCVWTATSSAPWITIESAPSQSGSGAVSLSFAANTGAPRSATLDIAGSTVTIAQRSPNNFCDAAIAPQSQTVQPAGGNLSIAVTVAANCAWTASESLPWVTIASGASGAGNGTVSITVAAHTGAATRSGTVSIAGKTFDISQQSPVNFCPATVAPATQSVPQGGGSFQIAVTLAAGCQWIAASDVTWATFTGSTSGSGSASFTANIAANAGYPRSTLLRVAGQTVRVSQTGPLTGTLYMATGGGGGTDSRLHRIEPSTGNVINDIGSIGYSVTGLAFHPVTRELYGVTNNRDPFNPRKLIRINIATASAVEIGSLGLPDGSLHDLAFDASGVLYAMSSLRAHSDLYRVDISTGAATRVGQAWPAPIGGAALAFSPSGTLYYANQAAGGSALNTLDPATGALTSGAVLSGRTTGEKMSGFAFDPYGTLFGFVLPAVQATPSRLVTVNPANGVITTIGRTVDSANSLAFYPSACGYSLSATSANTSAAGGPGAVNVQTAPGCTWTASSNVPWITVTAGATGSGPGAVAFSVSANLSVQRTGTISIAGETFTVTQQAAAAGNLSTPTVGVPNPASGSGTSRTFVFTFSDADGTADLSVLNVLIHDAVDGRNACYLAYVRSINTLVLVNDAGDAGGPFAGALAFPATGSISNSQCTINAAGSSATNSGNTLTLTLNVSFKTSFAGTRVLYMAARDNAGNNSGWHAKAVWKVTGGPATPLNVVSMTPTRSAASRVTFTTVFSDSTGFADLTVLNLLINDAIDGRNSCYIAFVRDANLIVLVNDAGAAGGPFAGALTLPTTGNIGNSQCTVFGAASAATGSGNSLTLTLDIGFNSAFAGDRIVWAAARDGGGNNTGWNAMATVTIP